MNGLVKIIILLVLLIAVSIVSLKIPLPGSAPYTTAAQDTLVIITPHWDGIRNEFRDGFTEWYKRRYDRSVMIEWLDPGGTSDCLRYIKSEFSRSPSGIGVDILFGGGTDPFIDLKRRGLLRKTPLDPAILAPIPRSISGVDIYDNDGCWYGAVLSGFGIIYNKWVAQWMHFAVPGEWKDLADPRYISWVGVADPRDSGTMHLMFEIILQAYGWDEGWKILTGIAANARTFSKGAPDVPKMVAKGDMAFGFAIDFYAWEEVSEAGENKVGFLMPANLTVVSADAMAVLHGAPHPQLAKRFMEFVLSEQGQKLWYLKKGVPGGPRSQELNRMPVLPDLYSRDAALSNVHGDPFVMQSTFHFNDSLASARWMVVNDLIGSGLIDFGDQLRAARIASVKHHTLCSPLWAAMPLDESTCLSLARKEWNNAVRKNTVLLEWHDFFEKKYRTLSGETAPCTK